MAIVNGTEFEFIDLQSNAGGNTTRHMIRDAQARADAASAKEALSAVTGAALFTFTQKAYIKTGIAVGSTVDLTPEPNAAFEYAILYCQENDKVTITGYGQSTNARLWAFLDADNKLLQVATGSQQETDLTIIAPPNTAKCVLNSYVGYTGVCYINGITKTVGDTIEEAVSAGMAEAEQNVKEWTSPLLADLKDEISNETSAVTGAEFFTFTQKAYIKTGVSLGSTVDLTPQPSSAFEYAILVCEENDKVTMTAYGQATNARLWAFLDADNKLLQVATGSQQETDLTIIAPPNTAKCVLNSYIGYTGVCYINGITKTVGDTIAEAVSAGNAEVEQNVKEWTSPLLLGLKKFDLPADFQYSPRIDVYSDGNKFATNFDPENIKNSGGTVIYVDNSGNSGTAYDGSTPEKATTFSNALYIAADGDTIMILENLSRDGTSANSALTKSVNVIGANGGITIFDGNFVQFSKVSGYNHVYSATRHLGVGAIDTTDENKLLKFTEAQSIAEVEAAMGSVFISGDTVYVHPYSAASITNRKILVTVDYEKWLDVSNADAAADKNVYFENITLIGRYGGVHIDKPVTGYDLRVCFNHCAFRFCGHDAEGYNAVDVSGGDVLFYRCKVLDGGRDGINYHSAAASGTEIDCIAAGNGKGARNNTMNGSTCHLGARCLRINGKYYDNQGANVADVQEDTQSVNLGCIAFQPACDDGYSQNFSAQQSGATVWLYNCIGVGAEYDLYAAAGTTLYADKCAYDVKEARGTIADTNNRKVNSALLFGMVMNGD